MMPRRSCACGAVAGGCTSICRSRRKGLDKLIGEPTSGLELISCSLRVSGSGLPSVARAYISSITMAYVGKRISGHAPEAGGLSVSALLHVVSGGGDVLPPGYELT